MRRLFIAVLCLALSSCGAFVPTVKIAELPIEQQREVRALPIFASQQLNGRKFVVLGIVEGISCQNKTWDPPATRALAIEQAKFYARELKADGIANLDFGQREGTSVRTNCWTSVTVSAEAIQFTDGGPLPGR